MATSEQGLRRMRQRIFDYPATKEAQADRVLGYLKRRVMRHQARSNPARGPYSVLLATSCTEPERVKPTGSET